MSIKNFNPNAAPTGSGIFGLPFTAKESYVHYLPVPWEATTSYGGGTSNGPAAILQASPQIDLFDHEVDRPYEVGYYLHTEAKQIRAWNKEAKANAQKIIAVAGEIKGKAMLKKALARVNELSHKLNQFVYQEAKKILDQGKFLALIGGDHSTPFGALRAIAEKHPSFGILHFDAHSDTRCAYEGFTHSHASIMYNILESIPQVKKLTQVAIRDLCEEEFTYTESQKQRVSVFFNSDLKQKKFSGQSWNNISEEIVGTLPEKVWVSFDIDGLDPRFCPHTGTPVPGGLEFDEAIHIIRTLVRAKKTIIGFDLNEVAPAPDSKKTGDEWDANVGSRLLYKLTAWSLASQGKVVLRK